MAMDNEIKKAIKEKKLLIGSNSVMKAARTGTLGSIIYARNAPQGTVSDIRHYSGVSRIEAREFPGSSMELGELCGKPFSILLLGIRK